MRVERRGVGLAAGAVACLVIGWCSMGEGEPVPAISLGITPGEKQLKLTASHPEIGLVFELHCYETGPFQQGTGVVRDDGSVVFTYKTGGMSSTTTFTPRGGGRIAMDVVAGGPLEELGKVSYVGPCM